LSDEHALEVDHDHGDRHGGEEDPEVFGSYSPRYDDSEREQRQRPQRFVREVPAG